MPTAVFVEIESDDLPVRIFEPIKLELSDGTFLEVVRVDDRISAQVGQFLISVDIPIGVDGSPLITLLRGAFHAATNVVSSLKGTIVDEGSSSLTMTVTSAGHPLNIYCANNI